MTKLVKIMAGFEEHWCNTKATIKERGTFMFNNDLLSDVSLVVRVSSDENEHKKSKMAIPAHRLVLSICSPVFFAMFCGEMAEKSDTIDMPDCEYEGVLEMLRYLYSEEVKLNESNVMQVLYVAKKYMLASLADECIDFLRRHVDPANVFCVLSHALQYDEKTLVDGCWKMIECKTEEVVKSEGFATIERSLLEAIVKKNTLTISEVELFKAVDLWASKECERQGLTADGNVKRKILGEEIVKSIRFAGMEQKEFASVVLDCQILTLSEVSDLMKNFNGVLASSLDFPEDKRVGTCQSCCRFEKLCPSDDEYGWHYCCYDDLLGWDSIELWVDNDIMLHGIRFFGSKDNEYQVDLKVINCQSKVTLLDLEDYCFTSIPLPFKKEKIYVFDFLFDPIVLTKNNHYVVKALMNSLYSSCYGADGVDTVECPGVTFYFKDAKKYKNFNATSVMCGQFHEFLFKQI